MRSSRDAANFGLVLHLEKPESVTAEDVIGPSVWLLGKKLDRTLLTILNNLLIFRLGTISRVKNKIIWFVIFQEAQKGNLEN